SFPIEHAVDEPVPLKTDGPWDAEVLARHGLLLEFPVSPCLLVVERPNSRLRWRLLLRHTRRILQSVHFFHADDILDLVVDMDRQRGERYGPVALAARRGSGGARHQP